MTVFRPHRAGGEACLELQLDQGRIAVPLWMTQSEVVDSLTLDELPAVSLQALRQLAELLRASGL